MKYLISYDFTCTPVEANSGRALKSSEYDSSLLEEFKEILLSDIYENNGQLEIPELKTDVLQEFSDLNQYFVSASSTSKIIKNGFHFDVEFTALEGIDAVKEFFDEYFSEAIENIEDICSDSSNYLADGTITMSNFEFKNFKIKKDASYKPVLHVYAPVGYDIYLSNEEEDPEDGIMHYSGDGPWTETSFNNKFNKIYLGVLKKYVKVSNFKEAFEEASGGSALASYITKINFVINDDIPFIDVTLVGLGGPGYQLSNYLEYTEDDVSMASAVNSILEDVDIQQYFPVIKLTPEEAEAEFPTKDISADAGNYIITVGIGNGVPDPILFNSYN